jgi:hypothetical protein
VDIRERDYVHFSWSPGANVSVSVRHGRWPWKKPNILSGQASPEKLPPDHVVFDVLSGAELDRRPSWRRLSTKLLIAGLVVWAPEPSARP